MKRIRSGFIGIAFLACAASIGCSDEPASSPAAAPGGAASPPAASADAPAEPSAGTPPAAAAPAAPADTRSAEELVAAGRATYNANCIACHSMDPRADGALGPAVAGASPELIAARVLRAEYPEGYAPKRETRVMVALPHLEPKLPELAAYLGSLGAPE